MRRSFLRIASLALLLPFASCSMMKDSTPHTTNNFPKLSLEAHRGGRGLYPEESIAAMKNAIDLPRVTTLEMDCHITKDLKVVVFHDDYLNPKFVLKPDGSEIPEKDKSLKIYSMLYQDLIKYDIGSKFYKEFPHQKKQVTYISKLADLIDSTEAYASQKRKAPMFYNIEVKSKEGKDGVYHPKVEEFVDLMVQVIIDKKIAPRTVIQSFDSRAIKYLHKAYPQLKVSYLIDANYTKNIQETIADLGFVPFIISPHFKIVTDDFVKQCHKENIKVIPWTVNSSNEIQRLQNLNVDGIISDYPDLF
ncbi:glycerophosphodiester phosphodiesterase [Sphingobacterium sp. N143]|uniref:glycerophosphodiester phosphodiesterase family protein n=1 Tax=Sphingobacterium sp. N143 TaxID=2746727 RepID=UPI0025756FD5|nr:glycerophosphodiester phosphodiesterase family protein [Sphingobacterium sp. N143]MDM1293168.1 glycerophosphodiester phosphodiesterase [Sphingobacterium sp. N143]